MKNKAEIVAKICEEIDRATVKFPLWPDDPLHALAVVQEEIGELQKEILQSCYEPTKSNAFTVEKEAIQTAAMAIRFLMSLDDYVYLPGQQHAQE